MLRASNCRATVQKLRLKDFEYHIPAAVWQAAEGLLRAQAVRRLQEVERHFWVATVVDGARQVEAEVIITPGRVKAFACECWSEGRRLMCPHIAAALVKIRQYLNQKAQEREAQTRAAEEARARRLNVDNILANTDLSDLTAFVRRYAERDATFALALKAHFAGKIADSEEHYAAVLRSAFPKNDPMRALKPAEMRRARLALDTLMTRANASPPLTAFCISAAVLQQLAERAATTEPPQRDEWLGYCRQALRHLIHSEHLAPEQREQAHRLLIELFVRTPYPQELFPDTLHFLARAARDESAYLHIRQLFDQAAYPIPTPVLLLFGAALAERGQNEMLQRILEEHFDEPERVATILETLDQLGYPAAVLPAGTALLEKARLPLRQQLVIESRLIASAEHMGDNTQLASLLRRRFCRQGDAPTLVRLRRASGANWPIERERLLAELYAQNAWDKAAALLAEDGALDALAALLRERADLSLLQRYEDHFLPQDTDFVRETYVDALGRHLHEHFGKQAAEYARDQLAALTQKGHRALATQIAQALIDRFPERTYLPEELAEAFPKAQRPTFTLPNPA
ncbi:MAG: hypothetical protein RMJ33_12290 [Saprospiraceae bacterium]|nr:hypothetical protein [Saprospiraceae bacterium]MDW8230606.1 hypothetical protein [Saprospiraceae bacterium]